MNKEKTSSKNSSSKRAKVQPIKDVATPELTQEQWDSSTETNLLNFWKSQKIYAVNEKNAELPDYVIREMPTPVDTLSVDTLHRKIHQDIFLKTEMMRGYTVAFSPQWETFPYSVEARIKKENVAAAANIISFRKKCRHSYGERLKKQEQNLKRLGIFADWSSADKTLDARNETKLFSFFDRLRDSKSLRDELRLSYWCPRCVSPLEAGKTALPKSKNTSFTYVKFPFSCGFEEFGTDVYFAIHFPTSQLWEIAGTIAIGIYEKAPFWLTRLENQFVIFSEPHLKRFAKPDAKCEKTPEPIVKLSSSQLKDLILSHPLFSLTDLRFFIIPDNINNTLSDTTEKNELASGVIPLNPAHHSLSYSMCKMIPEIARFINNRYVSSSSIIPIFDETGRFTEDADILCGLNLFNAIQFITDELEARGFLINAKNEKLEQLHCQHCDGLSVSRPYRHWVFSNASSENIDEVMNSQEYWEHYPEDIREPIKRQVLSISEMSISSQRQWGVPLPVLRCDSCNDLLTDKKILRAVRSSIRRGSEHWFRLSVEELLPTDTVCLNCHSKDFRKESTFIESDFSNLLQTLDSSDFKKTIAESTKNVIFSPKKTFLKWLGELSIISNTLQLSRPSKESHPFKYIRLHAIKENVWDTDVSEESLKQYPADVIRLVTIVPDLHEIPIKGNGTQQLKGLLDEYYSKYLQLKTILYQIVKFMSDLQQKNNDECHSVMSNQPDDNAINTLTEQDRLAIAVTKVHLRRIETQYEEGNFFKMWQLLFDFCQSELLDYFEICRTGLADNNIDSIQIATSFIVTSVLQRLAPIQSFLAEEMYLEWYSKGSIFKNKWSQYHQENSQKDIMSKWKELKNSYQTETNQ